MSSRFEFAQHVTRRHFLDTCQIGLASMFLGSLRTAAAAQNNTLGPKAPHHKPKAKSVIYLHMAGGPSQLELFDPKPELQKYNGTDCPQHLLEGKRFAFIKGVPQLLGTPYRFQRAGQSGTWVSELLPRFAEVVDEAAIVRSMTTEQFNHAPAQLLLHTGNARLGSASIGAWATYGLGTEKPGPAGIRGSGERKQDSQRRQEPVGQRVPAFGVPGSAVPYSRRPCAVPEQPRRDEPVVAAQDPRRPQ